MAITAGDTNLNSVASSQKANTIYKLFRFSLNG